MLLKENKCISLVLSIYIPTQERAARKLTFKDLILLSKSYQIFTPATRLRSLAGRHPIITLPEAAYITTWPIQNEELCIMPVLSTSVSCSDDCFSDLLCCEECDDETFSGNELPEYSSESEYSRFLQGEEDVEEWIGELIEHEKDYGPGIDYVTRFESKCLDPSARSESIAWILKVQRYYGFLPLTACLCVNYLDRFLYSRPLPETSGWPLQLLSVACLSLAVKMEERMVPSLIDLQVEGAKYIFEPRTIKRMEILVLSILDWRLRSITPFNFINFFAYKVDPCSSYRGFLISRSSQIILSNLQETRFLQFRPSCIAAATIICAANDLPIFSCVTPQYTESWCYGLHKDQVTSCLQFIQKFMENVVPRKKIIPKWLPQLQVMSRLNMMSNESLSSSSSSLSSSSSSKRRRLDKSFWTDDEKGTSK